MVKNGALALVDLQSCHPAMQAWRGLWGPCKATGRISVLSKRFKSTTYRIDGIGQDGSSIVAKYCLRETARHEQVIYEQVLRLLPITSPRYYGYVVGKGEYDWLFLEYTSGEQYSRTRADHSVPVARWLGLLHSSASTVVHAAQLPERSARHHLSLLREARKKLQCSLNQLKLPAAEMDVIKAVISQCNVLESHWEHVDQWCEQMPRTLIHGDFKPRNVVIRPGTNGPEVLVFDWEAGGLGVPSGDLAYIDIATYYETVKQSWPGVSIEDIQRMKIVGRIFRGIEEFRWESEKFDPSWEVSTIKLEIYRQRMAEAIEMTKWGE